MATAEQPIRGSASPNNTGLKARFPKIQGLSLETSGVSSPTFSAPQDHQKRFRMVPTRIGSPGLVKAYPKMRSNKVHVSHLRPPPTFQQKALQAHHSTSFAKGLLCDLQNLRAPCQHQNKVKMQAMSVCTFERDPHVCGPLGPAETGLSTNYGISFQATHLRNSCSFYSKFGVRVGPPSRFELPISARNWFSQHPHHFSIKVGHILPDSPRGGKTSLALRPLQTIRKRVQASPPQVVLQIAGAHSSKSEDQN
jgi:hypothetical protein